MSARNSVDRNEYWKTGKTVPLNKERETLSKDACVSVE